LIKGKEMTGRRWASRLREVAVQPTVEELVAQLTQQATGVVEQQVSAEGSRPEPSATTGVEEPVAAQVEEEAPAEAGLVDIAGILGAPTVTVVRSSL
jgi:hypothetical protein